MSNIRFWLGMNHRGAAKRTDKLLVGNIDNGASTYLDLSEILAALNTDDLPEGQNRKYITAELKTKLENLGGSSYTLAQLADHFYPLNTNPAAFLTAQSMIAATAIQGVLAAGNIPDLDAAKIVTGLFNAARIPDLPASKITSGTFHLDRIPTIPASKLENFNIALGDYILKTAIGAINGVAELDANRFVPVGRIPNLDAGKITSGVFHESRFPDVFLRSTSIIDNLLSDNPDVPLSAKQGKILKQALDDLSGATPTLTGLDYLYTNWQENLRFVPEARWFDEGEAKTDTREIIVPPGDATYDRFVLFYIDLATAEIRLREGVPSANPEKPSINPITELEGPFILIKQNATSPDGVTVQTIYKNNEAGEWAIPAAGPDFNLVSEVFPYSAPYCIETVAPLGNRQTLPFEAPAPVDINTIAAFRYRIKNIVGGDHRLLIAGKKADGSDDSVWVALPSSYVIGNTEDWQLVYINKPDSALATVTKVSLVSFTNGLMYYLDDFEIVLGDGGVSQSGVTPAYVDQKAAEAQANAIAEATAMDNVLAQRINDLEALQALTPVPVAASRLLTAADKGRKLFITAAVTLTYPAAGLGTSFGFNVVCSEAGQLTMADQAATPGDHLDAPDGKILEARKMAHCFVRPDNSKLTLQGSWIA